MFKHYSFLLEYAPQALKNSVNKIVQTKPMMNNIRQVNNINPYADKIKMKTEYLKYKTAQVKNTSELRKNLYNSKTQLLKSGNQARSTRNAAEDAANARTWTAQTKATTDMNINSANKITQKNVANKNNNSGNEEAFRRLKELNNSRVTTSTVGVSPTQPSTSSITVEK